MLDWFATFAPEPTKEEIEYELNKDKLVNPYGYDNMPRRRNVQEIKCDLKYEYAQNMIKAKQRVDKNNCMKIADTYKKYE